MKLQEQKGYNPNTTAGMVYVGMGNSFPIANATVEVDGTGVMRNGHLLSDRMAKAAPAALE